MLKNVKLNKQLYKVHLACALLWRNNWQLIQSFIDEKLKRQMEIRYDDLNKKLDCLQLKQQQCASTVQIKPKSTAKTVLPQSTKFNRSNSTK
jgi:hypothetical protein